MKKIKLSKKVIIISIFLVIVLAIMVYLFFFKDNGEEFALEKAVYGTVIKEVSETGTVKASEEANLSFKYAGRIQQIFVEVGDTVKSGQILARQDSKELFIKISEAQAGLEVAKAKKTDVQVSLQNARQNLEDIEADAEEDLNNAYEDGLTVLNEAELKAYNAYNLVLEIQRNYFVSTDQESFNVAENKNKIKNAMNNIDYYVGLAESERRSDIDAALSETKSSLLDIKEGLEVVRSMTETVSYRNEVSNIDKISLDNHKSYINDAYTDVINGKQAISTIKVVNEANINDVKAEIASLESQLKPGGLYDAQINRAEADISLLENKIYESTLRSPAFGQITEIDGRIGETVKPAETIISFLPSAPFKIEVNIYEEDVVKIEIGDTVEIRLVAFPDKILEGNVVSIDPAEKLIDDVVYYEINIDFREVEKGTKIGMTADIEIITDKKENVLIIPEDALSEINGKKIVEVKTGESIEEREVIVGLEGDDFVEIVSGLEEGEEVVIR